MGKTSEELFSEIKESGFKVVKRIDSPAQGENPELEYDNMTLTEAYFAMIAIKMQKLSI